MKSPLRLLLVEDDENDAALLIRTLEREGVEVQWRRVQTAEAMARELDGSAWDVVISDYSMPHFSGNEALELLTRSGIDVPFILVSGAVGEDAAVAMMKAGAQDFIMKGAVEAHRACGGEGTCRAGGPPGAAEGAGRARDQRAAVPGIGGTDLRPRDPVGRPIPLHVRHAVIRRDPRLHSRGTRGQASVPHGGAGRCRADPRRPGQQCQGRDRGGGGDQGSPEGRLTGRAGLCGASRDGGGAGGRGPARLPGYHREDPRRSGAARFAGREGGPAEGGPPPGQEQYAGGLQPSQHPGVKDRGGAHAGVVPGKPAPHPGDGSGPRKTLPFRQPRLHRVR